MSAINFALLQKKLLRWYDANRRDLPWRHTRDPYAIWLSETMLQQTQVVTVIPYYERFLQALPTPMALARAPLKKVLALWSGLGYYRRAENLKRAAEVITARHGGQLPGEYESLRELPGIGDYTAGALMSIAFGQRYAAVDGNARRVLSRLFALDNTQTLRTHAAQFVSPARPGDGNQALMELGATICAPAAPRCAACPLKRECAFQRDPAHAALVPAKARRQPTNVTWPLAVVCHNGKVLLRRRAANGLLARLWELPGAEMKPSDTAQATLRAELRGISRTGSKLRKVGALRHAITHRNIHAPIFHLPIAAETKPRLPAPHWRWIAPRSLHRFPVSSMTSKALKIFAAHEKDSL